MGRPVQGTLRCTVLEARNLSTPENENPAPFITLLTPEERVSTGVKDGTSSPFFDETFTLYRVTKDTEVTLILMQKGPDGSTETGRAQVPSSQWGSLDSPSEKWIKVGREGNPNCGEVRLKVSWSPEFGFRVPFSWIAGAAAATTPISKVLDRPMTIFMDIMRAYFWVPLSHIACRIADLPASRLIPLLLMLAGATFATVSTFVVLSLVFFPVTIFSGFVAATAALFLAPPALLLGWILLCTPAVQRRIVQPFLFKVTSYPNGRLLLLKSGRKCTRAGGIGGSNGVYGLIGGRFEEEPGHVGGETKPGVSYRQALLAGRST